MPVVNQFLSLETSTSNWIPLVHKWKNRNNVLCSAFTARDNVLDDLLLFSTSSNIEKFLSFNLNCWNKDNSKISIQFANLKVLLVFLLLTRLYLPNGSFLWQISTNNNLCFTPKICLYRVLSKTWISVILLVRKHFSSKPRNVLSADFLYFSVSY